MNPFFVTSLVILSDPIAVAASYSALDSAGRVKNSCGDEKHTGGKAVGYRLGPYGCRDIRNALYQSGSDESFPNDGTDAADLMKKADDPEKAGTNCLKQLFKPTATDPITGCGGFC